MSGISSGEERAAETHVKKVHHEGGATRSTQEKGDGYHERLDALRISSDDAGSPSNVSELSSLIRSIPYFPETLKTAMDEASEKFCRALADLDGMNGNVTSDPSSNDLSVMNEPTSNDLSVMSDPPIDELSLHDLLKKLNATEQEFVEKMAPEHQQSLAIKFVKQEAEIETLKRKEAVSQAEIAVSAEEKAVYAAKEAASEVVGKSLKSINRVDRTLTLCGRMSQAERTITMGTKTKDAAAKVIDRHKPGKLAGESEEETALFQSKQDFDLSSFYTSNPSGVQYQELQKTAEDWEKWIMNARHLGSKELKYKEKIASGVEWFKAGARDNTETDLSFPGPQSQEIAGAQQVFHGLLERIAGCWKRFESPTPFSPVKKMVKANQIMPATSKRPKRIVDVCISKPGGFLFVMFDHHLKLALEVKPFVRATQGHSLKHESFEQILGHLAKNVYHSFNLFGIGADGFATGMTCTLAYITVYKLELRMKEATNPDFEVASLVLYQSKPLPLMTQRCFKKWVGRCNDYDDHEEQLYRENRGVDEQGIPRGIRFLWEIMQKRRADFFGPNYSRLFTHNTQVGELLGTGTFSAVMGLSTDPDSILKVPILLSAVHIQNEKRVLDRLGRKKTDLDEIGLPILKEETTISFSLGGIDKEIQGLVLQPRGKPILSAILSTKNPLVFLKKVSTQLKSALDFIHSKKFFHNDVSPKNMIVVGGDDSVRAFLVDFGVASHVDEKIDGFVGTPLYTHRDIFHKYPGEEWYPKEEYDLCSLGFSIAALLNRGEVEWDMGRFPMTVTNDNRNELSERIDNRRNAAVRIITEHAGKETEWLSWAKLDGLKNDNNEPKKRKPEKREKGTKKSKRMNVTA